MDSSITPDGFVIAPEAPVSKPKHWYRRWWVYLIAVIIVLWFGLPVLLRLFVPAPTPGATLSGGFTAVPGASATPTPSGPIDVTSQSAPSKGSPVAPIVIVEFGDFQCPYCRAAAPIISQVAAKYPEAVKLEFRYFPLQSIHPEALASAEAAACAQAQGKFWQYHDQLYAQQDALGDALYASLAGELGLDVAAFNRCREGRLMLARIQTDYEAGVAAGVRGTPTWFVSGYRVEGALPLEFWEQAIPGLLQRTLSKPKS